MKLQFLGAARGVTGSKHLLTTDNGTKILLDCGLFQGKRDEAREKNTTFPFRPSSLDAVIIGHAHIDHTGNLPNLVKNGFNKTIYATEPTDALVHFMLPDSAYIQERDVEFLNKKARRANLPTVEPLYDVNDALDAIRLTRPYKLGQWIQIADDVEIMFVEAGHILGAALTIIKVHEGGTEKKLAYIVDLGRKDLPLLNDPFQIEGVDYAIIESTYGNRVHENIEVAKIELRDVIRRTYERGGKIIIPSFAVERTQEVLYFIHQLRNENEIPNMKVIIDSPLAISVTNVFREYIDWFDADTKRYFEAGDDPFGMARLEYVRTVDRSKELNDLKEPAIIISASGMAEAGRVLHHLRNNIESPKNTVMIVGFMAENTLGRKIADGMEEVPILGEKYHVRSEVFVSHSFSAHADAKELTDYVANIGALKKLFIVHGEEMQSMELALRLANHKNIGLVAVPHEGDIAEL